MKNFIILFIIVILIFLLLKNNDEKYTENPKFYVQGKNIAGTVNTTNYLDVGGLGWIL